MATPAQEQSRMRALLQAEDRALERDTRSAQAGTRRAIAQVARQERQAQGGGGGNGIAGKILRTAWRRPPGKHLEGALKALWRAGSGGGGPRSRPSRVGSDGKRYVSFHMKVGQSSSIQGSKKHQAYIERPGDCVVSFGNIADTYDERLRVWEAIGEHVGERRRGTFTIGEEAPHALKEAVVALAQEWAEQGKVGPRIGRRVHKEGVDYWRKKGSLKVYTEDQEEHQRLGQWIRRWAGEAPDEPVKPEGEGQEETEQRSLFGEEAGRQADPALQEAERAGQREKAREKEEKRKARAGRAGLPPGVTEFKPREATIQRRIVMELAHELSLEQQEAALREWCDEQLGKQGVAYHAVIHQPEGTNDARNWHAHIVWAGIHVEREKVMGQDAGRFTFETQNSKPEQVPVAKVLSHNGAAGRNGAKLKIREWRKGVANAQNKQLELAGAEKRYDPRKYQDQGMDIQGGQHHGTQRAALEAQGAGAQFWSAESPEWTGIVRTAEESMKGEGWEKEDRNAVYEALEAVRLRSGLHVELERQGGREDDAARTRVRAGLEQALQEGGEAGGGARGKALAGKIRALGREVLAPVEIPRWLEAWRLAKMTVHEPAKLEASANAVAQGYPGGTEALAADPRPEARALAAKARRYELRCARWRKRSEEVKWEPDEKRRSREAGKVLAQIAKTGLAPAQVLGAVEAQGLEGMAQDAKRRERMREALQLTERQMRGTSDAQVAKQAMDRWWGRFRDEAYREWGEREWRQMHARHETWVARTAVRQTWRGACAEGRAGVVRFGRGEGRHALWPEDSVVERAVFDALGPEERTAIRNAQKDPERIARAQVEGLQEAQQVQAQVFEGGVATGEVAPEALKRSLEDKPLMARLGQAAPEVAEHMRNAERQMEKRSKALKDRLERARIPLGWDERNASIARIRGWRARDVLKVVKTDAVVFASDHPELWEVARPVMEAWAKEIAGRTKRLEREGRTQALEEATAQIGPVEGGMLRMLEEGNEPVRALRERVARAEGAKSQRRETLRETLLREVEAVQGSQSRPQAALALQKLRERVQDPVVRVILGEDVVRGVEVQFGLRDAEGGQPGVGV